MKGHAQGQRSRLISTRRASAECGRLRQQLRQLQRESDSHRRGELLQRGLYEVAALSVSGIELAAFYADLVAVQSR